MNSDPSSRSLARWVLRLHAALFVLFMLTPLAIAVVGAFNDVDYPTLSHWNGFTWKWFGVAFSDTRLGAAALTSLWIIAGTNVLAIPIGLAGAILISRWNSPVANLVYGVLTIPMLTPGILLGTAMLIFWQQFGLSGGTLLAILAQTPELAAVSMMLFLSRLHHFDTTIEEASRDLGARPLQVLTRITLPFLAPTILSASALVTLLSFGNFNTTVFVIGTQATITTWIGSKVRLGLTPEVNAVAALMVLLTIILAVLFGVRRARRDRLARA